MVASTVEEPVEKDEVDFASKTKKVVGIVACLGLIIGLTLILIFMTNASKDKAVMGVTKPEEPVFRDPNQDDGFRPTPSRPDTKDTADESIVAGAWASE